MQTLENTGSISDKNSMTHRSVWKRIALALALCLAVGAGVFYISIQKDGGSNSDTHLQVAPHFELRDASGQVHQLEEWKGNVVLVHFWASWCPPCLGEIPQWRQLADEFKGRSLKLLAVSEDENWQDAQKVLPSASLPPNLISLLDVGTKVSDQYGSYQFPETYLLNSRLEIVTKWVGPQEWKNPSLLKLIDELLKNASAPAGH